MKVDGWNSGYESVDKLLRHLKHKTGSEGSRATYSKTLAMLVRFYRVESGSACILKEGGG